MSRLIIRAVMALSMLVTFRPALAADSDDRSTIHRDLEDSWNYQPPTQPTTIYKPNPRAIVQQKAMAYAQQRQSRLAAMNWYGMSNSRPTAAPTPFTSMYSPVWQGPGARPFVWYTSGRPTYLFR